MKPPPCSWAACPLPAVAIIDTWHACAIHAIEPLALTSPVFEGADRDTDDAAHCGTNAGARRHQRRGETSCNACRLAHNLHRRVTEKRRVRNR